MSSALLSPWNFLIIDDDEVFSSTLARSLSRRGIVVDCAASSTAALAFAAQKSYVGITVDLHLGDGSGLKLIEPLRRSQPQARMLILTGFASIATAVAAVKLGAHDYLTKPANTDSILEAMGIATGAPLALLDTVTRDPELPAIPTVPLSVARLEWEHIQRVLAQCDGNISEAARRLNMHRRTLQRKLAKHPVRR